MIIEAKIQIPKGGEILTIKVIENKQNHEKSQIDLIN